MGRHSSYPKAFDVRAVAAPVLTVLFLLSAWAASANAATHPAHKHSVKRPRVSLAPLSSGEAGLQAVATGIVTSGGRGARVVLQIRDETAWLEVGRGKVVASAYRVGFEIPDRGSELAFRSLLVKGGRTLAKSPIRTIHIVAAGVEARGIDSSIPGPRSGDSPTKATPEGRQPISITSGAVVVPVGSSVRLAVPGPFDSIAELGPPSDPAAGLAVASDAEGLAVSASAAAKPGSSVLHAAGTGCIEAECGLALTISIPITVTGIAAPPGQLEKFGEPSPDRISSAVDDALADELLVTLGTSQLPGTRTEAEGDASVIGGVVSGGIDAIGVYEIRWSAAQDLAARRATLEGLPGVAAVSAFTLDEYTADTLTPSIAPDYDQPWWIWPYEQIEAGGAWSHASGSDVTVGIIDVGNVFSGHEDLHVAETIPSGTKPEFHATHVAGLACARGDNQLGMTGMEPGCPLVSYGVGGMRGFFAHVLEGMTQMSKRSAVKVVNVSLGENAELNARHEHQCATLFEAEQFQAHAQDAAPMFRRLLTGIGSSIVWTFSAGNNCTPGIPSPWGQSSDLPNVVVVGATNSNGALASFSDYGRRISVVAPGGVETDPPPGAPATCGSGLCFGKLGLLSAAVFCTPHCVGSYGEMAGTSMSAPLVAGVAALLRSTNPSLSAGDVGECIKLTAGIDTGYAGMHSSLPAGFTPRFPVVPAPDIPIVNASAAVKCASPETGEPGPPAGPEVVSVDYQGVARAGHYPRISRDGRFVWFESADDLVPGIRLERSAVYIRDLDTRTTRRIDLPDVNHSSSEELLAISPSGRYGLVAPGHGLPPYLVDQQANSFTPVSRYLGYSYELGLENDGDTVLKAPSEPAPGATQGNVADLYSISGDQWTSIPCPIQRYNREEFAFVNLDNDGFAAVSSYGCRPLASGYEINLATNAVAEVIPGFCNNGGNACVESMATNETGSHFVASLCCTNLEGDESLDYDGQRVLTAHEVRACGLSSSGRYAVYRLGSTLGVYDSQTRQSAPLTEPEDGEVYDYCAHQSVTADGTVVYQRQTGNDWDDTQVLLTHP